MRQTRIKPLLLASLLAVALPGCSRGDSSPIRLGTGGIGGTYYSYGTAFCQQVGEDTDYQMTAKTTAGSAANLRLLSQNFLEMAIVQSDTLEDAAHGTGLFEKDGALKGYSAVASLYVEPCQIIVPADSPIDSIDDLMGLKVSVGEEESGVIRNAEAIMLASGITFSMIDEKNLSFVDSAAALKNGEIDAFFCTAGVPTTAVSELAQSMDIRLLSLSQRECDRILKAHNGYTTCTIPAGSYAGQTEDVTTVGVKAVLVASDKLSKERVSKITGALFTHAEDLSHATSAKTELTPEFAVQAVPIAFHSGAVNYYNEKNISVTENNSTGNHGGVFGGQDS